MGRSKGLVLWYKNPDGVFCALAQFDVNKLTEFRVTIVAKPESGEIKRIAEVRGSDPSGGVARRKCWRDAPQDVRRGKL